MTLGAFFRSPAGLTTLAGALAVSAVGLLLNTASIAAWMAHPARVGRDGSIPATTLDGAALARIALIVGPWLLVACAIGLARLCEQGDGSGVPGSDREAAPRRAIVVLVGIVAIGVMLRVPLLNQSLWYDEIVPFGGYSLLGPGAVIGNYYSQANHVFSQLLIWCSTALLGADEFSMRLPALMASVLSIVAVWGAAREASDDRTALFAAGTMAVMPLNALAGTDARGYAIAIAGAAVALWAAARARRTGSFAAWSLVAFAVALAAWAHMVAIVFALGLGCAWLVELLRRRNAAAGAGIVALIGSAILTLVLYAPILPDIAALRRQFGAHDAGVPSLLGPETWHALLGLGGAWTWWAAMPGFLLAGLGFLSLGRHPALRPMIMAGLIGFPLAFALAAIGHSWLYARFLLFVLPALALLMGVGCEALARRRVELGVAALCIFAVVAAAHLLTLPPRQPLREALAIARGLVPTGQSVGVIGLRDNPMAYYGIVQGVELVDFGDRGANVESVLKRVRPGAIVILYPASLPASVRETLRLNGYGSRATLPGWIDWGAGEVEVVGR